MVKQSSELTEKRIRQCFTNKGKPMEPEPNTVGIHLFVMQHGF